MNTLVSKLYKRGTNFAVAFVVAVSGLTALTPLFLSSSASAATANVFSNIPSPLASNYPSLGFEATQTSSFGLEADLGGTGRFLNDVTVVMSSWACETGGWNTACVTTPGATFSHPITVNLYNVDASHNLGSLIATQTQTVEIPYRPSSDPLCSDARQWRDSAGNCFNGYAFTVTTDFTAQNKVLPENVAVVVAYNTAHYGATPIGVTGPYDSLNVAVVNSVPSAGAYGNDGVVYWNGALDTGWTGQMPGIAVRASDPTNTSETIVVTPANLNGWEFNGDRTGDANWTRGTGAIVTGPVPVPLGAGSAEITTDANSDREKLRHYLAAGTLISNITELKYNTYRTAASDGSATTLALQLDVDFGAAPINPAKADARIVYEPYLTHTIVNDTWQEWDTQDDFGGGNWWIAGASSVCPQGNPCTWSELIAAYPDMRVSAESLENSIDTEGAVMFKAGGNWGNFAGNVDKFVIGVLTGTNIHTITYDFDPTPAVVVTPPVTSGQGDDEDDEEEAPVVNIITPTITSPATVLGTDTDASGATDVEGTNIDNPAAVDTDGSDGIIFGLAWYWWLLILAGATVAAWWIIAAIRRRRAEDQ